MEQRKKKNLLGRAKPESRSTKETKGMPNSDVKSQNTENLINLQQAAENACHYCLKKPVHFLFTVCRL